MKNEYINYFFIMAGLTVSVITPAHADMSEMNREVSESCSSKEMAKKVVTALPESLYKIRTKLDIVDERYTKEIQMKIDSSKWE